MKITNTCLTAMNCQTIGAGQGNTDSTEEDVDPVDLSRSQSKLRRYMQQLEMVFAELKLRNRGYGESVTVASEVARPPELM
jgi:hypothetical protein